MLLGASNMYQGGISTDFVFIDVATLSVCLLSFILFLMNELLKLVYNYFHNFQMYIFIFHT